MSTEQLKNMLADLKGKKAGIQSRIDAIERAIVTFNAADSDDNNDEDPPKPAIPKFIAATENHKVLTEQGWRDIASVAPPDKSFPAMRARHNKKAKKVKTNIGVTDAIRFMLRGGKAYTAKQVYLNLLNDFEGMKPSTVSAILSYHVRLNIMTKSGSRGHVKYALKRGK